MKDLMDKHTKDWLGENMYKVNFTYGTADGKIRNGTRWTQEVTEELAKLSIAETLTKDKTILWAKIGKVTPIDIRPVANQ